MSFDFEKLDVYNKAREARRKIFASLSDKKRIDRAIQDQLKRSSLSIILNIAEGSGKFSKADKRNFYYTARGSVYEVVAIADVLFDDGIISEQERTAFYNDLETVSKMLLGLINSLK